MTRLRLVVTSALLALAALVTPAAMATSDTTDTTQAQDVGWGYAATTTGEGSQSEPDEATPEPTDNATSDVGWG
ncbi:hypothetical protein KBY55_09695 [Streptomyces sp. b94]|uniref:hypothetical protein n=1 Tax=Streptomyces sp. b94 TaxID=1827634 RepID=UPI001B35F259|nr:hypothetical protein [Streptomyces sp. b94]MBQ1096357.1 hypothetical protein [Streptomyces sp. b94]